MNEMAREVLQILRGELKEENIATRIELKPELPVVLGHKGQLQEVLVNLINNAIEALDAIQEGNRTLQLRTERMAATQFSWPWKILGPESVRKTPTTYLTRSSR